MKPILFNTEMVKALLDGRKTVTRRVIKNLSSDAEFKGWLLDSTSQDDVKDIGKAYFKTSEPTQKCGSIFIKQPYEIADIIYVRETFCDTVPYFGKMPDDVRYEYKADETAASREAREGFGIVWTPSIHMPKAAARIFLKVTDVRVERLQDMETSDDCNYRAEGAEDKHDFISIWDSTVNDIEKLGWYANPWVWVIEFERIDNPELLQEVEQ